jgi:hypothetical protein
MPRPEPKKDPQKKVADFYTSEQDHRYSENYPDVKTVADSTIDATRKTLDTITRIFWNHRTQKSHISEDLVSLLEPIWDSEIAPVLIREFGQNTPLSVIFYQGKYSGEVLMEIWDPLHVKNKSSQVFAIRGVPKSEVRCFATSRQQAQVLNLNNWI